jgi:hypothetical protein
MQIKCNSCGIVGQNVKTLNEANKVAKIHTVLQHGISYDFKDEVN